MPEHEINSALLHNIENIHKTLTKDIAAIDSGLLKEFPIEVYIEFFDRIAPFHGYRYISDEIVSYCQGIALKSGKHSLDLYHRLVLVSLINSYRDRKKQQRIPASIQRLILQEFDRVIKGVQKNREGFYFHENDLFAKDLGLCRLKLLPCGSELVDLQSGIPRRTLLQGGISQFLSAAFFFIAKTKGFKPYYESHWDRRLIKFFSENEYNFCYARIADLLRNNPEISGMFSASWWFDPQLEIISPELAFLRTVPEDNGAKIFRIGTDPYAVSDAIKFSSKRKELYDSGRYRPQVYLLVWSRKDMLHWAMHFNAEMD
ncbi:hypothetical protein C8R11_104124 [Nitrosomonas aestuarii]|nr:hypothetical protein C8R11_104124 [Nitrosomonas aestuarii]